MKASALASRLDDARDRLLKVAAAAADHLEITDELQALRDIRWNVRDPMQTMLAQLEALGNLIEAIAAGIEKVMGELAELNQAKDQAVAQAAAAIEALEAAQKPSAPEKEKK